MIHVEAGEDSTGSITLINEKNIPVVVDFLLRDFRLSGSPTDHKWVELANDSLQIESKQKISLNYTTSIPEGATGEYSVRIRYHEKPQLSSSEPALSIKTAVSVPFYAVVSDTERYNCKVESFRMNQELANEATVVFNNTGNAHVRPSGHCWIKKIDSDQILCSAQLNSGNSPVYPDKERTFKIQFDEVLPLGKYVAELQFSLFANADESNRASFEFEVVRKPTL
ncbi:MAG: hypothetical protein ACJAYS_001206 [Lentimonas sp.]|jgi:hypothetical protein